MSLSKQFKVNSDKELNGVWLQLMQAEDESGKPIEGKFVEFCLARMSKSNTEYTKCFERITKPFSTLMKMGQLPVKKSNSLMMDVFIEVILKGWNNVPMSDVTGDQKDTGYAPFNAENARSLFTRLPELYDRLFEFANDAAAYKDYEDEEKAKNS